MSWRTVRSVIGIVSGAILLLAVYVARHIQSKSWYYAEPLTHAQFQSTNFTVREIPTTYYHVGEIGQVLNGWYQGSVPGEEGYFHLFRVHPESKSPFTFDLDTVTAKTQVDRFDDDCVHPESVLCKTCMFDKNSEAIDDHQIMNVSELLRIPSNYYSSFGKLDDMQSVRSVLDAVNIPGIDYKKIFLEHAFIGNFARERITAFMHGTSTHSSMAVQFVGQKVWLFFSPRVFKDIDMLYSYAAAGISLPSKGPDGHFWVYRYESQPGDILFFAENWGHTVMNRKGPNFMMNFRRLEPGNILRRPLEWIQAVYYGIMMKNAARLGRQRTPFNELQKVYMRKLDAACREKGRELSPFDKAMVKLMKGEEVE